MSEASQCGTCRYAQNRVTWDNMLHCRRWPPVTTSNPGHPNRPLVMYNDWCGEYEAGVPADPLVPLPVNRDIPYAWQDGGVVNCTMGNWANVPDDYAYQWRTGDTDIGVGPSYIVTEADVGRVVYCVVTATNAGGSVDAPPSNSVTIVAPP